VEAHLGGHLEHSPDVQASGGRSPVRTKVKHPEQEAYHLSLAGAVKSSSWILTGLVLAKTSGPFMKDVCAVFRKPPGKSTGEMRFSGRDIVFQKSQFDF
jgi:hypothetical protein